MTLSGRPLVFVLEDDRAFCEVLVKAFEDHGFATESFRLGRSLERRLADRRPALCLVDMQLPDGQGLDLVVRRLRGDGIPVILISGVWTELSDRVLGLEQGADDYLVKPFSPREAVARARAVLRRCESGATRNET
ncbi:MAG: response regulator transcription factor, partial [Mangrovicoccus sp.]|nr:response regulator transcription factor [Mangrovicoccus sp.]